MIGDLPGAIEAAHPGHGIAATSWNRLATWNKEKPPA
jgi:hypothetical protein